MKLIPRKVSRGIVALCLICFASACVQLPTETQKGVDLRPQITFSADPGNLALTNSRVIVNGIDVGAVSEFLDGVSALRILPGTHEIKVLTNGKPIFEQRFYIGDGVRKSFTVR